MHRGRHSYYHIPSILGQVMMFAGEFAPEGFALCKGQIFQVWENDALFSLIGTIFGGNGRTTFALPDFRGRFPTHAGTGPGLSTRSFGQKFGQQQVQLGISNLPSHTHTASVANGKLPVGGSKGSTNIASGNYLGDAASTDPFYRTSAGTGNINGLDVQMTNADTGASRKLDISNPALPVSFIISLRGTYPSRSRRGRGFY